MSEVAYTPPRLPDPTKYFVLIIAGFALIIGGALAINHGIGTMSTSRTVVVGVCLFVAGVLMIFAGASRVWQTKPSNNLACVAFGIFLLVVGVWLMAAEWQPALTGMLIAVTGIAMVFGGAALVMKNWKNYLKQ
ncbi:MAG: hypothetical protein QXG10_02940 [Candidatus Hadarchaeales archaeon]